MFTGFASKCLTGTTGGSSCISRSSQSRRLFWSTSAISRGMSSTGSPDRLTRDSAAPDEAQEPFTHARARGKTASLATHVVLERRRQEPEIVRDRPCLRSGWFGRAVPVLFQDLPVELEDLVHEILVSGP